MLILISGLPSSGKSSFADAIESKVDGFTHVPLDKYIKEVPEGMSFLDWVDTPACIDWELLGAHLEILKQGNACFTPQTDWRERGSRTSAGGVEAGGKRMQPAGIAYLIPGCHAFRMPAMSENVVKVFIETSHETIADRLRGNGSPAEPVAVTFQKCLSKNWKEIEEYRMEADFVVQGTDDRERQIRQILDLLHLTRF